MMWWKMTKFKISGNQTAIKEILNLLDPSYVPPFMCRCFGQPTIVPTEESCHQCECPEQTKQYEEAYGSTYHQYEVELDKHIIGCKLLQKESKNLLDGCVA